MPDGRKRLEFSRETKRRAFERAGGRCEHCGVEFRDGMRKEYDHRITDYHKGGNGLENCQVLCQNCHGLKTGGDRKDIAKSERYLKRSAGVRGKKLRGAPLPGTKASGIKLWMNGSVSKR